jgi:hypothetical protein
MTQSAAIGSNEAKRDCHRGYLWAFGAAVHFSHPERSRGTFTGTLFGEQTPIALDQCSPSPQPSPAGGGRLTSVLRLSKCPI